MATVPSTAIELIWPDGSLTSGATYAEVEAAIRAEQWTTFRTRREFRRQMRHRAGMWSGTRPPRPLRPQSAQAFLQSLAAAGMFVIHTNHQESE